MICLQISSVQDQFRWRYFMLAVRCVWIMIVTEFTYTHNQVHWVICHLARENSELATPVSPTAKIHYMLLSSTIILFAFRWSGYILFGRLSLVGTTEWVIIIERKHLLDASNEFYLQVNTVKTNCTLCVITALQGTVIIQGEKINISKMW